MSLLPTKVKGGSSQRSQGRRAKAPDPHQPAGPAPITSGHHLQAGQRTPGHQAGGQGQLRRRPPHEEAGSVLGSSMEAPQAALRNRKRKAPFPPKMPAPAGHASGGAPGLQGAAYLALAPTLSLSVRLPRRGPIGVT